MAVVTVFKNFTHPVEDVSLIILSNWLASDKYKPLVEEIRCLIAQGKTEEAQTKKQQLPAFTPSATFKEKRLQPHMEQYSGFVHLDFDKLTPEQLTTAFQIIIAIPYTFLCFISPSGNGLKVFIEVKTGAEHHDTAYLQVMKYYEDATGLKADVKCKDITRLCFVSHDPQLYKNIYNEKFTVQDISVQAKPAPVVAIQQPKEESTTTDEYLLIFQQQILFTNQKTEYIDGNRNNYIYHLASNCNRVGIPQPHTEILCSQHYNLPEGEIKNSVSSAYKHHQSEFAKFANAANNAKLQSATPPVYDPAEDYLKTTPTFPEEVFDALPHILKEGVRAFTDSRKRDVFLTGALSIISGCLPKVTGIYFNERVYPHLFTFIIAPSASGKGVLNNAKRIGDKYHQKILQQSRDAQKIYETELAEFKRQEFKKNKGAEPAPEKPQQPPFKIVFIPADCSQARMVEHLQANEGQGIICETEADTMSGAKKQDWGDYSPILRSAFHHEKISISRKTGNEYVEINEPRLAVALSGTPAQAPRLIASAEDGLFSRFLFYAFKNNIEWQDPSPKPNTIVYNDHFDAIAGQIMQLINQLEQTPTIVQLQPSQWQVVNTEFPKMLAEVVTFTSEDAAGVVYRLGLVLFRICMIFSALRKHENGDMTETITCTDEDFNTALLLVQTYLQHSLLMFNNLPKQNETMQFHSGDNKRKFFDALPQDFTRQQAVETGKQFQLAARTVDDILRNTTGKALEKLKPGHYRKI